MPHYKEVTKEKTDLQIEFESQTPTINNASGITYLQTFLSWLHFQLEKERKKNPI